jgi:hypothetical protein
VRLALAEEAALLLALALRGGQGLLTQGGGGSRGGGCFERLGAPVGGGRLRQRG